MPKSAVLDRAKELKTALRANIAKQEEFAASGIKINGDQVEVKSADAEYFRGLVKEAEQIEGFLKNFLGINEKKSWLDGNADGSFAMRAAAQESGLQGLTPWLQTKTIGELFTGSEEFKDYIDSGRRGTSKGYELEVGDITSMRSYMERKDVYGAMNPQIINQGLGTVVQFDPLVPRGHRPTRVRDLFPVAQTSANLIDYFQVLGFLENQGDGGAAPVADYSSGSFGLKPRSNLNFNPAQAPVRTIAHWEAAHRNILDDVPQLIATINNELLYGLQLQEDFQILNGDGTTENLLGILNTPGINLYVAPSNELGSDTLRRAATLSMLAYYPSTGYVLHPSDWEKIELQKGTVSGGGDGQYMLFTNIAIGAQAMVWRQPVVETSAMQQGTFLSGAFGTAAQVYDRQAALVRVAEQHSDLFARNAIAILCEERIALAVKRPEAFVKGTFQMP